MKQKYFWIFGIVFIFGIIFLSSCIQQTGPQIKPCNWVFKTDSTNIGHMSGTLNSDRTIIIQYGGEPDPIVQLDNNYFTMMAGCAKDFPYSTPNNFVFFKATTLDELYAYDVTGENVDLEKLQAAIKDGDPFSELYFCFKNQYGATYTNSELNKILSNDQLSIKCERII